MPNLEMKYLQIGNQTYQIPSSTVPTNISAFNNDVGYITDADIPEGASAYTGTISAVSTVAANGSSNAFARGDHVHNITGTTITSALGYTPYNSTNPNGYTSNTGTITSVKTTAGAHSTINVTSGAANFNVPTKTSHLTNDSGYITDASVPDVAISKVTGISIGNHSTTSIIGVQSSTTSVTGVQSSTTVASKVSLGTAFTVPNITSAGSASNWVFQNVTVPVKAASAVTVPIKDTSATSIPNVTAVGSGSASLTMTMDTTDTKQLNIAFSHTHTPPTLGTAISITGVQSSTTSVIGVQSTTVTGSHVKSGGNGTAPTLGTAFTIPNVTGATDVTVPIKDSSATTVPIKATSATTVVTSSTHSITDNGHSHTLGRSL